MKKTAFVCMMALILNGCGSVGNGSQAGRPQVAGIGTALVQSFVQNQCVGELQKRNEWRLIALAMSSEKQQEWENRICSCAGEEVPRQISAADLPSLLSQNGRDKVVADVTIKTVTACFQRLYKKN